MAFLNLHLSIDGFYCLDVHPNGVLRECGDKTTQNYCCTLVIRGFASVGIIALVDEATGYQYERPRKDLEEYLKKVLSEGLRRWVRTFLGDYFKHLCRLKGVQLRPDMKLPHLYGEELHLGY